VTRGRALFGATAGVLLASTIAIGRLPSPRAHIAAFLLLFAAGFIVYALAARAVLRVRADDTRLPWFILIVCALGHAALIPARPDLSPDVYRYIWEGRVSMAGDNPYAVAPGDSALTGMRDADYGHITFRNLGTIYPPLAQGAFALAAGVRPRPATLKVLFSLFNLATVLVLFRWLRRRGRPPVHALVFAWNPLVWVETAYSGHVDAMAAFFLVLALYLWDCHRRAWAAAAMGGAVLAKYLAAATLPWLARRRLVMVIALMVLVVVAGYAPFWSAGTKLFASLGLYAENWWFNGPPFLVLSSFLGDQVMARHLLLAGGVAFMLVAAIRERDLARYMFLVVGCVLLLSPTVYPWYLVSFIPLVVLFPSAAWIAFSALVMLSYVVLTVIKNTGVWMLPAWLLAVEYIPFYLLLLMDLTRNKRRAPAAA